MAITGKQNPGHLSGAKDVLANGSRRGVFPSDVLPGHETALLLFAAGFYGKNDGVWVAEAGIRATCVDMDTEKLRDMEQHYPHDWLYVHGDVFEWAERCPKTYDLVTVDPPMALSMVCLIFLDKWAALANKTIVLGCQRQTLIDLDHTPGIPGWPVTTLVSRNAESIWLVLQRST